MTSSKDHNVVAVDLFDPQPCTKGVGSIRHGLRQIAGPRKGSGPATSDPFWNKLSANWPRTAIISVRLALFAEMMKGKPWTSTTLRGNRRYQGVGVTFLEETFGSVQANPKHRLHQKAAQTVLKALLPETGTDIKGQMRSRQELLEALGNANRPRDFDDLIHILDAELRLITPTDPEGSSSENQATRPTWAILPAHTRLSGPLTSGLVNPQAKGNPSRSSGTAAGGAFVLVECQAREPPFAVSTGVGQYPAADQEDGRGPTPKGG